MEKYVKPSTKCFVLLYFLPSFTVSPNVVFGFLTCNFDEQNVVSDNNYLKFNYRQDNFDDISVYTVTDRK